MTDTLTRAANAAAEALGMSVELYDNPLNLVVQVFAPGSETDKAGRHPTEQREYDVDIAALAYLEGLECGARIMRERQASLITYFRYVVQELHDIYGPDGPENKNDDSYLYAAENALLDFDGKL